MQKILLFGTILMIFLPIFPNVLAEQSYSMNIAEHSFDVRYELNGDVIAMAIDPDLTSLLVGVENTKDSLFKITFDQKLINAENNGFAILVNGLEVDYSISETNDDTTLSFYIEEGTEEIEIIGTHVIPEFPFGVLFGFILMTSIALMLSRIRIFR